ncbi:hypothetical protein BH10PSE12_BH10PSE12_02500 [soil metagenome]
MRILLCMVMLAFAPPVFAQANNGNVAATPQAKVTTSKLERKNMKRWCMMYPVSCKQKQEPKKPGEGGS